MNKYINLFRLLKKEKDLYLQLQNVDSLDEKTKKDLLHKLLKVKHALTLYKQYQIKTVYEFLKKQQSAAIIIAELEEARKKEEKEFNEFLDFIIYYLIFKVDLFFDKNIVIKHFLGVNKNENR